MITDELSYLKDRIQHLDNNYKVEISSLKEKMFALQVEKEEMVQTIISLDKADLKLKESLRALNKMPDKVKVMEEETASLRDIQSVVPAETSLSHEESQTHDAATITAESPPPSYIGETKSTSLKCENTPKQQYNEQF